MSKKSIIILLFCILLIGGILRFYKLGDSAFDRDEFFELNSSYGFFQTGHFVTWDFGTDKPFPANMQDSSSTERAEIFRWQLSGLYHFFQPSAALTRGLCSFWGVIGIALVYFITLSFTGNVYIALLASFLTAVGSSEVIYSRRLRMYAMFFPVYLAFSWAVFKFYEEKYKGKITFVKNFWEKFGFNLAYFIPVAILGLISLDVHVLTAHIVPAVGAYAGLFLIIALYQKKIAWGKIYYNKYFLTIGIAICGLVIYKLPILNSLHKLVKKNFSFFLAKPNYGFVSQYFSDFSYLFVGIVLFLFGTWFLAKKMKREKEAAFLFISAVIPMLFAIFTWKRDSSHRYIYFVQSFCLILSAVGVYGIITLVLERLPKYKKPVLLLLIIIFLAGINFSYIYSKNQEVFVHKANSYYPNFAKIFKYVLKNKKPGDVLVTRAYRSFYWQGQADMKVYDIKSLNFGSKDCADKIKQIVADNPSGIVVYAKIDKITQCGDGLQYYKDNMTQLKDSTIPSSVLIYRWGE